MKIALGIAIFELICLLILVVVTIVDQPQPIDRWLIVMLPLASALFLIVTKSRADNRPGSKACRQLCAVAVAQLHATQRRGITRGHTEAERADMPMCGQATCKDSRVRVLHELVLEGLDELSDEDRQDRLWRSDGNDGEVSSLEEAWATAFDDSGLADALERGPVYSEGCDGDLVRLGRLLRRLPIKSPPE